MRMFPILFAGVFATLGSPLAAQVPFDPADFDCGGDLVIESDTTLDLPPDGILCYGTITVNAGILSFRPNALNTPVYLLSVGDLRIDGSVDVSARDGAVSDGPVAGGPGGFAGGHAGVDGVSPPGAGHGPGGGLGGDFGQAGRGAFGGRPGSPTSLDGQTYASPLLIPLVGGSGGGGTTGNPGVFGGGGGGAVLLASNTRITIGGGVRANGNRGGLGHLNGGSGGAIRLVAPIVAGGGNLVALSVNGLDVFGGPGRIRIDLLDRSGLDLGFFGASSVGSFLVLFPDHLPRLDITHAAGQDIPPGTQTGVVVNLPLGSSSSQRVTVEATDFVGTVDLEVVVVPDSGDPVRYPAALDMGGAPSVAVDFQVEIPVNSITHIFAWVL